MQQNISEGKHPDICPVDGLTVESEYPVQLSLWPDIRRYQKLVHNGYSVYLSLFMSYRLLIQEVKKVWSLGCRLTSDYWIFKWFLFFFSGLWWRGCGGRDWCPDWAAAFSQAHCQKYWCRVSGQCYWWVDNFFWILLPHKIVPFSILSLQYAASQFSLRKIGISSKWNQVYKKCVIFICHSESRIKSIYADPQCIRSLGSGSVPTILILFKILNLDYNYKGCESLSIHRHHKK